MCIYEASRGRIASLGHCLRRLRAGPRRTVHVAMFYHFLHEDMYFPGRSVGLKTTHSISKNYSCNSFLQTCNVKTMYFLAQERERFLLNATARLEIIEEVDV